MSRTFDRRQWEPISGAPIVSAAARSSLIAWLGDDGGMSESSSGEEFEDICPSDPPVPKWPLPPSCAYDTELYAFWDILVRPHGVSVRRLESLSRKLPNPYGRFPAVYIGRTP